MGFFDEFRRGLAGDETRRYRVEGLPVKCPHCGGEDFDAGTALLNSRGMTLLGLDWANREASLLICTTCSEVRWFLETPERV
jgi:uncharacterized protein